jgi:hypothetical protein
MWKAAIPAVSLALVAAMSGCRVNVEKSANGGDKNVQVDTPFGGVHVNTDRISAADLGLPVYPGAQQEANRNNRKSADVHLGFGEFQLRVRTVSYTTADAREQVTAFYKKALGRYGDVIVCQGNAPVGTPTSTAEGLTCDFDGKSSKTQSYGENYGTSKDALHMKAGSKRHQHIVAFDETPEGKTRFTMVALDLPAEVEGKSEKSD